MIKAAMVTDRPNLHRVAAEVKERARALGFDLVGIAPVVNSPHRDYLRGWLDAGRHGSMQYLADRFEERVDPAVYLPDVKTAVCVAVNYNAGGSSSSGAKIARYARAIDYHEWIKPKLYEIADWLRDIVPGARTVCGVDTAPILERELAARAGIGWVGKNTIVLNERIGSWLFLAEVLTTIDLPIDTPAVDRCGTCTRCIDACPTDAITPYQLDARRCISYLTIEHEGQIEPSLADKMNGWVYGCDICQEVCPWNGRAPIAELAELQPMVPGSIDAREILDWSKDEFDRTFRRTAAKRIRLPMLQRNARLVMGTPPPGTPGEGWGEGLATVQTPKTLPLTPSQSTGRGKEIIAVIGPTASGKSALALQLAEQLNAEILAVDSMTVYRGMDIGTAKPSTGERARVRHHLIDVVDPDETFTVARFVEMADAVIADAKRRGARLIAAGGTPLYFKSLFEGIFEGPSADPDLRGRLNQTPSDELHARLKQIDLAAAARIHVNDRKRLVRAIEVFELTGRPISEHQSQWADDAAYRHPVKWVGLRVERELLNRRINARVRAMMEAGWLEEVRGLLARETPLSRTAAEAAGYSELIRHLRGELSLDEAVEQIKISTRQLARRQIKWFRRFRDVEWRDVS
jgi:epoxyqueuosine reductase/tRNA dimethylallyltransferase